jgi:predicted aldo/keto reductase-like oxidoreductase
MDRRKFLGNSGKHLVALNLLGLTSAGLLSNESNKNQTTRDEKIICRVLGKTGISLPVVSMGVMNASNPNLVKGAWESGIRHFDTAWYYQNGNNEKMVGSVLQELKVKREEVTIATKVGLWGVDTSKGRERKENFLKRFDESLSRLKMDYADILYYHAAMTADQVNDPFITEAYSELKEKKKIRFAGFSAHNYWPDLVNDAVKEKFYDVLLLSFNYSMFEDQKAADALKLAYNNGIGLVAMKTQCQADWYKRDLPAEQQKYYRAQQMNTALLKWTLQHEFITTAIPGFTSYEQLEEDMAVAYNLDYTKEEEEFLKNNNIKLAIKSVCRQCGFCIGSCPKEVDIPALMRTRMYAFAYGNPLMAKQTLSQIPDGHGLANCSDCEKCTGTCRYRVPIESHISDLKDIYC